MNESTTTPTPRKRNPLRLLLGGLALLILCVVLACAANAAYWTYVMRDSLGTAETPPLAIIQAETEALPPGDAANGEKLFNGEGTCQGCHALQPGEQLVGPSLAGISERAATTRPGYSAETYLYESIAYPHAYANPDHAGVGLMPTNFKERLTPQQLADLIAFLMTQ